jgi:hypothetical protein
MTAVTAPRDVERWDWRTIVFGGARLGVLTAVGVAVFSLTTRATSGTVETIVQAVLILLGGAAVSFLPASWTQPRSVDGIAWTAMLGLMGSLWFALIDIALLRPLGLYAWRWDLIGGGSPFWYLPVWWMGAATLAWLGAWVAVRQAGTSLLLVAAQAEGLAIVLFAVLAATIGPFTAAIMALAYALALVLMVPLSAVLGRR